MLDILPHIISRATLAKNGETFMGFVGFFSSSLSRTFIKIFDFSEKISINCSNMLKCNVDPRSFLS